jgi:mannosyltransferase OCH1-like enzyme
MIPKDIYICHKNLGDLEKYSAKWKLLNPTMNIHLYDDEKCIQFFKENYPPLFLEIFLYIKDGPIKADFWRICVLFIYGGCYVDADIEPFVPLSHYINFDEYLVTCISEYRNSYNPHIICCEKHNKIIHLCIQKYITYYKNKKPYSYEGWSIVFVFINVLGFSINNNISGEYIVNNKKYKFLKEQPRDRNGRQYCNYMGRVVLSNRYVNYKNHSFVNTNELTNISNVNVNYPQLIKNVITSMSHQTLKNRYKNIRSLVMI